MKSIAFFNNKGGVGKTTLLCNVAAYAALKLKKRVCVIDADPQCNATQYFFDEKVIDFIYDIGGFTVSNVVEPLMDGEGYVRDPQILKCSSFGLDVLPGDPNLAIMEDFLAREWASAKGGDIRAIKTNLVFSDLLDKLQIYDYVFLDVSPSLGAINRSILLSSDYFVSPMSIDIFSLRAFGNIQKWIDEWKRDWDISIKNVQQKSKVPTLKYGPAEFIGYVTQQYLAKRDANGESRGVKAYEEIRKMIDSVILECGLGQSIIDQKYEIGTVPNLFSLAPMSQSNNKPIFDLKANDGVVGAHFAKVKDAEEIFKNVTLQLFERIDD
ncbi:AAA family ATPase [Niveispirillum sp. BGYR6]|uniref:ParA family protein n=1 Tax=Niveispirillum sp. BGYR6 TaxID=2971249 RepID=UPI0022B99AAD|nr:AAA family ATPase [Niveispirillum sp. BGYR6]MDG5496654.1 AAA family ATPase [Niveispirillum sp. BGYR6]